MQSRRYVGGVIIAAALILVGCTESVTPPSPPQELSLSVVSGDQQTGSPGSELPNPLVVKVTKPNGAPVNDQVLNFRVVSGGGSVFAGTALTDQRGIAQERWTLGSGAEQRVEVRAVDNETGEPLVFATFTATAICDCWASKPDLPTARAGLGATEINGKLYVLGGYNLWVSGALEVYDPSASAWAQKTWMPTERWGLGVAATGGILYAVGGVLPNSGGTTATLQAYDPASNTWTTKAPMPTRRHSMGFAAVNGILYAIGGNSYPEGTFATVEAYNPATDSWTTKTPMPTPRYALGVAVVNGIIYAIGGDGPNGVVRTVEAYDPATDTWTTKASMPVGRYVFGIGVLNGAIYVAAGSDDSYTTVAYLKRYDPATDSWSYKAPLPGGPRREHTAAAVGGVLYVVGGNGATPYLTSMEAYQP